MAASAGKLKWYGKVILGIGIVLLLEMIILPFVMMRRDDRLPNLDKSYDSHVFLASRGYGDSFSLTGDVVVNIVFVNDPEAQWTDAGRSNVMLQIMSQTIMLKEAAAEYGAELNLNPTYHYVTVDVVYDAENYHEWAEAVLQEMGYTADNASSLAKKNRNVKEAPYMFCTPRDGRSFARAVEKDGVFEYGILYADGAAYAHELSHLFGAEDFYYPEQVKALAEDCFGKSIMLDSADHIFDSLTAYLVGWTDEVSEEALRFLDETAWITKDIRQQQYREETITGSGTRKLGEHTYTGQLKKGIPHGEGKLELASGDVYEGQFRQGVFHGYGKYTYAGGNIYEGQFFDGNKQGTGKYSWANGDVYEGEFFEGLLRGTGRYTWADGTYYEGEFENGKFHGQGKQVAPDGRVLTGRWENGEYVR